MPNAEKLLCLSCVCVRVSQSSVAHPLLQLVPHLHERRTKRFGLDVRNTDCMLALPLFVGPVIAVVVVCRVLLFRLSPA